MSYFCANTISIDRTAKTCRVKGGDNNIVPRSNYWTDPLPLAELPYHVGSGCIQFTTRSDKNVWVEAMVLRTAKAIESLTSPWPTGSSSAIYLVGNLPDDLTEQRKRWEKSVADGGCFADESKRLLEITADEQTMKGIADLKAKFVADVLAGPSTKKVALRYNENWVCRVKRHSCLLTPHPAMAVRMSAEKAADVVERFPDMIVEAV